MKYTLYTLEFVPGTGELHVTLSHAAVDFFNAQSAHGACEIGHFQNMKEAFKQFWNSDTFVLKDHNYFGLQQCGYFHYTSEAIPQLIFNMPTTNSIYPIMASLRVLFTVLNRHNDSVLQPIRIELPDTYSPRVYLSEVLCKKVFTTLDSASDALRMHMSRVHVPIKTDVSLPQDCGISMDTGLIRVVLFNGIRPQGTRKKCTSVLQEMDGYLSFSQPVANVMHAYELIVAGALVSQVAEKKEPHLFIDAEDSL